MTWREEYNAYILSEQWRRIRINVLARADGKCEACEIHRAYLEVHHLHYKTFKNESLTDLVACCPECHKLLDAKRESETFHRIEDARFHGWCNKVYGEDGDYFDEEEAHERYCAWLENRT